MSHLLLKSLFLPTKIYICLDLFSFFIAVLHIFTKLSPAIMSLKHSSNSPPPSEQPPDKKLKSAGDQKTKQQYKGIDIPDFSDVMVPGRIKPIKLDPNSRERLEQLCVYAMDDHNKRKDTNYQFVELKKANGQYFGSDIVYNVTIMAKIPEDNPTKIFEARVQVGKLENGRLCPYDIYFCREKKASQGDNDSDDEGSGSCIDPEDFEESEDDEVCCTGLYMTDVEMEEYKVAFEASDGFNVPDFPGVLESGRIVPIELCPLSCEELKPLCDAAMAWYNEKWDANYQFVDLEKVNGQVCCGIVYYLTFVGRIPNANTTKTFEARVLSGIPEYIGDHAITVYFCREKVSKDV